MPTRVELDHYLANAERIPRPDRDVELTRLHRVTAPRTRRDEVLAFAFVHRTQFFKLAQQAGADESRIPKLKQLFVAAVADVDRHPGMKGRVGLLCDDRYGQDALNEATGRGWWIGRPVELPGSNPLVFDRGRSIGTTLIGWPSEHVAKCLVQYHPDDAIDNRLEQEAQIRALYDAVQASGHELLLEIVPPKSLPRQRDTVYRALKRLYNLGIFPEWWKLEPMDAKQWDGIDALIAERDSYCRGVLILGQSASIDSLSQAFRDARGSATCRGFAVGRTIFEAPSRQWLSGEIDDAALVQAVRASFDALIDAWQQARPPKLGSETNFPGAPSR
jgi:5-dehydro-2-deoxygluconokinase